MMMLTSARLDPAEEEDRSYLSIARPVAVGVLTFLSLGLLVVCLLATQTGQKLMPHHQSNSHHSLYHSLYGQPSAAQRATQQLPSFQRT